MTSLKIISRIEKWRIDSLIPYARNPRTHSPSQIAARAAWFTSRRNS